MPADTGTDDGHRRPPQAPQRRDNEQRGEHERLNENDEQQHMADKPVVSGQSRQLSDIQRIAPAAELEEQRVIVCHRRNIIAHRRVEQRTPGTAVDGQAVTIDECAGQLVAAERIGARRLDEVAVLGEEREEQRQMAVPG